MIIQFRIPGYTSPFRPYCGQHSVGVMVKSEQSGVADFNKTADFDTFTKEILNGKLHFLYSE